MQRRTFLQTALAAGGAGLWGTNANAMRIDHERLEHRNHNRSTVAGRNGMVCTSQPLAVQAGVDILKAGGSAVDAAIAANAMLTLVEPHYCGPGGDLFAIVWDEAGGTLHGLNASGRSPYAWSLEKAQERDLKAIPPYDPLSWSVPGCVSGWQKLHERFGKLALDQLFAPVLDYAREGFPLSPIIASTYGFNPEAHPTLAETFMPTGEAPAFGDVLTNPQLADFYDILLRDGLDAFYEGEIAERIIKFSKEHGGLFTMKDFTDHTADWIDPVSSAYRGYDVWELPPNGQGIAALQILNMLEHFDIGSMGPNSPDQLHLFVEAKKLAFEDRAKYYADPEHADVPVSRLISKAYAAERVKLIDPKRAAEHVSPGTFSSNADTVYLTTADSGGNMVSLIQSTYHGWGSHIVPGKLGFPIQNRGVLFALDPEHRNRLEPHKRPFHTIIPAFVTRDERPVFSFGVMGGDFQPQGHAQVLMNLLDFGMSPQQAGDQPRVSHDGSSTPTGRQMRSSGQVQFEHRIPETVIAQLEERGHRVSRHPDDFGGYQGIWREEDPRRYYGGSDPRKDGLAGGY